MDIDYANYLLKKTKEDYNDIAEDFSTTRYSVWEEFAVFKDYIKDGDKVLDLGCGNGRMAELFKEKNMDYTGADNSERLIEIAKKSHKGRSRFVVADALNLPFPENHFDKILSVAVLHHIPSEEYRLRFLKEAHRVLKPGGLLILTVWDLWQKPAAWKSLFKLTILKIKGESKLDFKDIFVPWQKKVNRYFHCFTKNELKRIVNKAGFKIREIGTVKRARTKNSNYNIYLLAEK